MIESLSARKEFINPFTPTEWEYSTTNKPEAVIKYQCKFNFAFVSDIRMAGNFNFSFVRTSVSFPTKNSIPKSLRLRDAENGSNCTL